MQFSISEAAQKLNVSIHTLRYYEKEGLIPALKRDYNGNRVYTESEIQWIYMIRCLRDTGMSIQHIKKYIILFQQGKKTIPQRQQILTDYLDLMNERIALYEKTAALLKKKLEYYCDITAANAEGGEFLSDSCGDYFEEWEDFKRRLEDSTDE